MLAVDDREQVEQEGKIQLKVTEHLLLTLEEALFLIYAPQCTLTRNLSLFSSSGDSSGPFRAASCGHTPPIYHFHRSKVWLSKPLFKYGSDLMLCRKGPPFCHASYSVVLQSVGCGAFTTLRTLSWSFSSGSQPHHCQSLQGTVMLHHPPG